MDNSGRISATSWEGRPLQYLVVASPDRIAKLDAIKRSLQTLAAAAPEADRVLGELPAVVYLIHGVHGNEISSADAALGCGCSGPWVIRIPSPLQHQTRRCRPCRPVYDVGGGP